MYTKPNSNLVNLLLLASLVISLNLVAAKSLKDDISSKKNSDSISDENTKEPIPTFADKPHIYYVLQHYHPIVTFK